MPMFIIDIRLGTETNFIIALTCYYHVTNVFKKAKRKKKKFYLQKYNKFFNTLTVRHKFIFSLLYNGSGSNKKIFLFKDKILFHLFIYRTCRAFSVNAKRTYCLIQNVCVRVYHSICMRWVNRKTTITTLEKCTRKPYKSRAQT